MAIVVATATSAQAHEGASLLEPWAVHDYLCSSARCTSTVTSSGVAIIDRGDLVGFWQRILNADGFATICSTNGIDGFFGSRTEANTRGWQAAFDLTKIDGIVGPQTWTQAEKFVKPTTLDPESCDAVSKVGVVTMTLRIIRRDSMTMSYGTLRAKPVRCRSGARDCEISIQFRHPPTEWAFYEIRASFESDGEDLFISGGRTRLFRCLSVAGTIANCSLPF